MKLLNSQGITPIQQLHEILLENKERFSVLMKNIDMLENRQTDTDKRLPGTKAQIRDTLNKVESEVTSVAPDKRIRKILKVLKKKDKEEIVEAVLEKFYN
ncbi:MAG: hypothetical protein PVF26_17070, partial [Desulfobacterales bacterium]